MKISAGSLTFILFLAFVAMIQIGGCRRDPAPPVPIPTPSPAPSTPACNCIQYNLVCNNGTGTCVALECQLVNNNDGRCSAYGGPAIPQPLRAGAASLFGITFSSYQDAIRGGKGTPDSKTWNVIDTSAPSEDVAYAVRYMTNDFIYIAFAQDVALLTPGDLSKGVNLTSISDKKATLGLIEAIKSGTIMALKQSDASKVKAPVSEFFKKNPSFKPTNPGFCYSENNPGTQARCIGDALEKRLQLLIGQ